MPEIKRYHELHEALHIGCERPTAYFVPFASQGEAGGARELSPYFTSLCGEWSFAFFENIARIDIEAPDFLTKTACEDKINVPGCWQLNLGRGYDAPNYINQDYPFPVDPPHLPDVIPAGLYRRALSFTKKADKRYYLNFEGVSSCFYLWINGVFVGYSQVSHCTSSFEVTDYLADGGNTFDVLVVKHCDGSYLEDQDFFRLSGIFREVYILEREQNHIADIELSAEVAQDFSSASLKIKTVFTGRAGFGWRLTSPSGETLCSGECDGEQVEIKAENPLLWNPEQPLIYELNITAGKESIRLPVGFKRFEIKDKCVLLNGKKIKAKGINRHDSDPETGYWVTPEQMLEELYMLKRASVNTIRTSHYPNDPRFLEMCDRLGFMVIDEADIETHGMGYNFGDWYWDYWAHLSDTPEWREAYLDRAERLYERDKNHACVIMWSLGNESGCGENHRAMAQFIRSRDPRAVIHYENAHLVYQGKLGKDFSDISDVESRMYASIEYLREYLADPESQKPFFYCEYVDSMSTGEIGSYWDGFEDNDMYFGGCVWEFCDHAVNVGTKQSPLYRYGGDFGDWPNDNYCCVDGLVYPDRSPRPGYYDMKKVYEPFSVELDGGAVTVRSKRFFTDLSDLYIYWTVETDGRVVDSGKTAPLDIPARGEKKIELIKPKSRSSLTTLNLYFRLCDACEWAQEDYEIGFAQFTLCNENPSASPAAANEIAVSEGFDKIEIACGEVRYTFDKALGCISSLSLGGRALISEPISFNLWRACTYNTRHFVDIWKRARYDKIKQKTYKAELERADGLVVVKTAVAFASAAMPPAVKADVDYIFAPDGSVEVKTKAAVTGNAPALPRFGLSIVMPEGFEQTAYLGYGPKESYCDRYSAMRLSLYETTATADYEHYIKPQEASSHYGTRQAGVYDAKGVGLKFVPLEPQAMCFKAIHYTDSDIHSADHDDELTALEETIVSLDYKINASNTGEAGKYPERIFDEKEFEFRVRIEPQA